MPDDASLLSFVAVALALLVTPGPAVAFVLARSLELGRKAGVVAQLGLCCGLLVHVAAAALGLSALIARSELAYSALRYLGALYLIWLGVRTLSRSDGTAETSGGAGRAHTLRGSFVDGFVIDALNPKPALFFLALLPQFVDARAPSPELRIAGLGVLFVLLALLTGTVYAWVAGAVAAELDSSRRLRRLTRFGSAAVYLALGGLAAFVGR